MVISIANLIFISITYKVLLPAIQYEKLAADSLTKFRNLKVYNSVDKNDFTPITKTYLDYSTPLTNAVPKLVPVI